MSDLTWAQAAPGGLRAPGVESVQGTVEIDPYRRHLQRAHVEELAARIEGKSASKSDMRPLARGELKAIQEMIAPSLDKVPDRTTRLHLEDMAAVIDQILDPGKSD